MKRKNRIKELKSQLDKSERTRQANQKQLDKLEGLDDLKMSVLWKALEKVTETGYTSKAFSLKLENGNEGITCTIITDYHVEDDQQAIIREFLKEKFNSKIQFKNRNN